MTAAANSKRGGAPTAGLDGAVVGHERHGRPSTVAVPVMTPSAGRSLCSALAKRPSSTKLPPSTSRRMRSRAKSLPASAFFSWALDAPPCLMRSISEWYDSGCMGTSRWMLQHMRCWKDEGSFRTPYAAHVTAIRSGLGAHLRHLFCGLPALPHGAAAPAGPGREPGGERPLHEPVHRRQRPGRALHGPAGRPGGTPPPGDHGGPAFCDFPGAYSLLPIAGASTSWLCPTALSGRGC